MRTTLRAAALVAVIVTPLAACSDDESGDGARPASASTSAAAGSTTTAVAAYTLPFDGAAALLADGDVRRFAIASTDTLAPGELEQPVCGTGVPSDVAGSAGAARTYDGISRPMHFEELLYGWSRSGQARRAFDLWRDDLACGEGSFDPGGGPIRFDVEPIDLGRRFGDASFAYAGTAVAGGTLDVIFVGVRLDNHLLVFNFSAPTGATTPDARAVVELGTDKLRRVAGIS
jgi:hypothetical protein